MMQYVIDLAPYDAARQWSISWACVPQLWAHPLVKFYMADYAQRMEAIPQARSPEALYGQILAACRTPRDHKQLRDLLDKDRQQPVPGPAQVFSALMSNYLV